jgi:hypothetical protein
MSASLRTSPDFQRGVIYTVHPRILAPLVPGEEYRILVSTQIRLSTRRISAMIERWQCLRRPETI